MREVKERLTLQNLHIDHVTILSELQYLIGAKGVKLKWLGFGGKTSPIATDPVIGVIKPVLTVWQGAEPEPELNREFGTVANTQCTSLHSIIIILYS